jgi:mannan endo-1,4-beta-mannosidase
MMKIWHVACAALAAMLAASGCVSTPVARAPATPPEGIIAVNDSTIGTELNQFQYEPDWNYGPGGGVASRTKYEDDDHYTAEKGAYFQVRFSGTNVKVYGTKDAHHGEAMVSVDGGPGTKVTYKGATRDFQVLIFDSGPLPEGEHTVRVTVAGNGVVTADRVDITQ